MTTMKGAGDTITERSLDSHASRMSKDKLSPTMYVIFLVLIIDLLGFTVILPLMPSIFQYYASNKEDHLYHWMESKANYFQSLFGAPDKFNKVLFAGLIGSVFSALQFLVAPIYGSISDVYGRKAVLIFSMIGIAISNAVWCSAEYFYLFIIARIIGGLSRANISLSAAIVTDLCSERNRGKGMALIGIAFGIGFIVGPMIGAAFASHGAKSTQSFYIFPALFALFMSLIDIVLIWLCFKESLPQDKRASSSAKCLSEAYQFINPLSLFAFTPVKNMKPEEKRVLKKIGLIYFLFLFIYSGLEYTLSFLTHTRFHFTRMEQGRMYLFSGIIMILVHGVFNRRISPGNEAKSAAMGAFLIIPSFIIIGISPRVEVLYLGLALYAFASATVVPHLTTIASKFGSVSQKGIVLGIFRSLGSLARAFGPVTFSIAFWSLTPTISYCVGGLLLIVPLYMIWSLKKELPKIVTKED